MERRTLRERIRRISSSSPDASIVVPVNVKGDLDNVLALLADLSTYEGEHSFEIILVVNNYPIEAPPIQIARLESLGVRVLAVPDVRRDGYAAPLQARIPGLRAAASQNVILFDADCRIVDASALLDWYVAQLDRGVAVAYTRVDYHDLPDERPMLIRTRVFLHHLARWIKRVPLGIPTTRGSNYAVDRSRMLEQYDATAVADDLNVGPAIRAGGGRTAYSAARRLRVTTSGRVIVGRSWIGMVHYFFYRLRYNIRNLPVRKNAAAFTGRSLDYADERFDYIKKQPKSPRN